MSAPLPPVPDQRRGRSWSIRTLLIGLVFGCLLPGALGLLALFAYEYQRRNEQIESDTVATARALVQTVDTELYKSQATALALSDSPYLAAGDFAAFHRQARQLLEKADMGDFISLIDDSGRFILHTQQPFGSPLSKPANPDQVRQVFATGRVVTSGIFFGPVTHRPIVSIYVPVMKGDQVTYCLGLVIPADRFARILESQRLPSHWVASIFDGAGAIAARTHLPEEFVGKKGAPALAQRLQESTEGSVKTRTLEGIPIVFSYSRSPVTGWGVVIGIPNRERQSDLARSLLPLGFGIACLFALGALLTWRIGKHIAASMQALIAPSLALGAGESVTVPEVRIKEADDVAASIGTAARLLKQRTQALEESERRLALALEAGGSAVWEMVVASRTIRGDDLLFAMLGYAPGELASLADWMALVHADDRNRLAAMVDEVIQGKRDHYHVEMRLRNKDGAWRWIFTQAVAAGRDGDGQAIRLIGTHTDITERKAAETEVRRLNIELEDRVRERTSELERSNEALLRTNLELQHFAHAAAHDLQTPLRSIAGFAQLLRREIGGQMTERVDEWSTLVIDNAMRLQVLIQDLLAYTQLEAQGLPFEAVDFNEVAEQVAATLAVLVRETGAEIRYAPLPTLPADHRQIALVLKHLIENGIKYNQSRPPRVTVSAESRDDEWIFSTADNGIGVAPRFHDRIFEIFRRLHTYSQVPGTGIGLALCRRILERHGGRIWVESQPGEGSTFRFTLPVRPRGS